MFVKSTSENNYVDQLLAGKIYNQQQEESNSMPRAWKADVVNISDEARNAYKASGKPADENENELAKQPDQEDPRLYFKEYMRGTKGEVPIDPLEALEKQLKALQDKIEKIAKDEKMSAEAKGQATDPLIEQAGQVARMIEDLKAKMAAALSA